MLSGRVNSAKIRPMRTEADLQAAPAGPHTPKPLPLAVDVPESRAYRLKSRLLGPPLATERLAHERLGIPTALAVFSSDCISSSAYATEQILTPPDPVHRPPGLQPGGADHRRSPRGAGLPDPLLPGDHQGVPDRGRRLHGHPGQLRPAPRPGRRRRSSHRLRAHRGRVHGGGYRRPDLGVPGARPLAPADRPVLRRPPGLRQPQGREGVGPHLRHAHLFLHRHDGR